MDRYKQLGLRFNPFPIMPTPVKVKFVSGKERKEKLNTILEQIQRVKQGKSVYLGIVGDWGDGKSHMLKHIEYRLKKDPIKKPDENIAIYILRPYDPREKCDLCYLCSLIIKSLNIMEHEDFISFLIEKIFSKTSIGILKSNKWKEIVKFSKTDKILGYFSKKFQDNYRNSLISDLEDDWRNIREMELELDLRKVYQEIIKKVENYFELWNPNKPEYIDKEFLEDFFDLFFEEIQLEDLETTILESIQNRIMQNNEEARKFLKTLINLAKYADYKIFAILIDEIDQVPSDARDTLLGELTVFLEESGEEKEKTGPPGNLMIALAYTSRVPLSGFYERRILRIPLERISRMDARETILDYLNDARITKTNELIPLNTEAVIDLWQSCGGIIGDILKCCFWVIEELNDQDLTDVNSEIINGVLNKYLAKTLSGIPPEDALITSLVPDSLEKEAVIRFFKSHKIGTARSKLIEIAVRKLCKALEKYTLNDATITHVHMKGRRRLRTEGGKKKFREVDVYLKRQKGSEPEEIVNIEVKAYEKNRYVKMKELEGSFELLELGIVGKLIIVSLSEVETDVTNKMKIFDDKARKCKIDENQLAQLLYSTDKSRFGKDLTAKEAKIVAESLGLLEFLKE